MPAGTYTVKCTDAKIGQRGRAPYVLLTFEVVELAWNDGVELKQWYTLPPSGPISAHSKYGKAWALAAGREMKRGDDLDPVIFKGKLFRASVGFRSNGEANDYDQRYTEQKTGDDDFLRVHRLEERID